MSTSYRATFEKFVVGKMLLFFLLSFWCWTKVAFIWSKMKKGNIITIYYYKMFSDQLYFKI